MIIQQCQKLVYIYLYHVAYTEEILFQIFYKYVYIKTCYDYYIEKVLFCIFFFIFASHLSSHTIYIKKNTYT